MLLLLVPSLILLLPGPCRGDGLKDVVDGATIEHGKHGELVINATASASVFINGVDVLAELKAIKAIASQQNERISTLEQNCEYETTIADGAAKPWRLAARFSNDGVDTWTYSACSLWSNDLLVGKACGSNDFKGAAFLQPADDMLFKANVGGWIAYEGVLGGSSVKSLFEGLPIPCTSGCPRFSPTRHSLPFAAPKRCSLDVYLKPEDKDGANAGNFACGFVWSFRRNNRCPLDDAGETGSLGPSYPHEDERLPLGFLGNNDNQPPGAKYIELYVR